ncbi:efflux RND transporter periplasmic adaptor subunit [Dokdonella sp.]|uniref:efflux RND transporter periplasmic adaptor subunit n=1 Tax=Dokdonella sp. TaxID=2291710 RepID=UPI0025BB9057|nr:efflux RND transporter periplasmic adaptor subunit [Dokdonella sp.]MBX3689669.1 efflux RND transporter periplasmic adaptor subunit [Dokdonella sp.]
MHSSKPILILALTALLAACGSHDKGARVPPLPELPTLEVGVAGAGSGQAWDGVVEAVQRADLAAQTSGRVAQLAVDVNDRVAADAVLLRITAAEQDAALNTARAQLRAAEAGAAEAQTQYARYESLSNSNHVSRAQLDQARAARNTAAALRDAARAQVAQLAQQASYTVVRAPFAGIIARRSVEPGETVAPGQPLLAIYAPQELRIEVAVPQTQADAIRADPRAHVRLADGRVLAPARVIVFPAADAASHSVNVRVLLPALDPPPAPGTTAKVVFEAAAAAESSALLQIPASAVAQRGELSAVYVLADGQLLLRQLRLGARQGAQVEVISGLRPGERIVTDPVAAMQALIAQRAAAGTRHD